MSSQLFHITKITKPTKGGWQDFLDFRSLKFSSFKKCKRWAKKNKINDRNSWINNKNRPKEFPKYPERAKQYQSEWKGWADFLGKEDQCQMSAKKLTKFILN